MTAAAAEPDAEDGDTPRCLRRLEEEGGGEEMEDETGT